MYFWLSRVKIRKPHTYLPTSKFTPSNLQKLLSLINAFLIIAPCDEGSRRPGSYQFTETEGSRWLGILYQLIETEWSRWLGVLYQLIEAEGSRWLGVLYQLIETEGSRWSAFCHLLVVAERSRWPGVCYQLTEVEESRWQKSDGNNLSNRIYYRT